MLKPKQITAKEVLTVHPLVNIVLSIKIYRKLIVPQDPAQKSLLRAAPDRFVRF